MLLLAGAEKYLGLFLKAFGSVPDGCRACILGKDGQLMSNVPISSRAMLSWLPPSKYLAANVA
jgi:hypothetical protein